MKAKQSNRIIGYYERENIIVPIFNKLTSEEFKKKYPGKKAVLACHLVEDDEAEYFRALPELRSLNP